VTAVRTLASRLETDSESVERDLFRLVLSIIELVRQLMERQALRRMDDLSDTQVEHLGTALMRLEDAMTELRSHYDLSPADLNLDLGPLGSLLDPDF
jgi:CII-binding regulator of phage lambda lysogenization HflD